jgi:hypothetical protein
MAWGYSLIYGFLGAVGIVVVASAIYRRGPRGDHYDAATDCFFGLLVLTVLLFTAAGLLRAYSH